MHSALKASSGSPGSRLQKLRQWRNAHPEWNRGGKKQYRKATQSYHHLAVRWQCYKENNYALVQDANFIFCPYLWLVHCGFPVYKALLSNENGALIVVTCKKCRTYQSKTETKHPAKFAWRTYRRNHADRVRRRRRGAQELVLKRCNNVWN